MKIEIYKENCDLNDLQNIVGALVDYGFKFDKILISNED